MTVVSRSPYGTINHPSDGEMRSAADPVPLVGLGRDLEDGDLTGAALVWSSSLDGMLGTGETLDRTLSVGVHTITLSVTDSSSITESTTIALTMQ